MIKLRAIGRCLFFLQSCRTSNYVRSVAMSWFQSDVCVMERLRNKILLKLSVRVVSYDLAPPPQRRRRRHPPPPPPRNLPFVTFHGSKETYLSLHYRPRHQLNTAECRPWAHDHSFRKCVQWYELVIIVSRQQ